MLAVVLDTKLEVCFVTQNHLHLPYSLAATTLLSLCSCFVCCVGFCLASFPGTYF